MSNFFFCQTVFKIRNLQMHQNAFASGTCKLANNTDSSESVRIDYENRRVYFKQFGAEIVKRKVAAVHLEVFDYRVKTKMSRPARKPTLWPLRNVSTQISLCNPRRLIRAYTFRRRRVEIWSNDS